MDAINIGGSSFAPRPTIEDVVRVARERDIGRKSHLKGLSTMLVWPLALANFVFDRWDVEPSTQATIYQGIWTTEAYYEFFIGSLTDVIRTLFNNPAAIFLNPFRAAWSLTWYFVLQISGFVVVQLFWFAKISGLEAKILEWASKKGNGNSIVNMDDPMMFLANGHIVRNAIKIFAQGSECPSSVYRDDAHISGARVRYFNLDVAKTLLLFSSAMYERIESKNDEAVMYAIQKKTEKAKLMRTEAEAPITAIAQRWGLKFAGVSDLNSYGGAYCGLWWQEDSNWVVISFKGTTPFNGAEWLKDLTIQKTNSNAFLFGALHKGFYSSLFTNYEANVGYSPYGTIAEALTHITTQLKEKNGHEKVNLYVTGHSLGSAIAEVFYARAVKSPRDFGADLVVKNAYLFGSPRIGDANWAAGYYSAVNVPFNNEQMLYRVIDRFDMVCHFPPGVGDHPVERDYLQPHSFLNYAHIGEAVRLTGASSPSISGNMLAPGVDIRVVAEDSGSVLNGIMHPPVRSRLLSFIEMIIPAPMMDHLPSRYLMRLNQLVPTNFSSSSKSKLSDKLSKEIGVARRTIARDMEDLNHSFAGVREGAGRLADNFERTFNDVVNTVERTAKTVAGDIASSTTAI